MSEELIAYRYSKVLFDLSEQQNVLEEVHVYLEYIAKFLVNNEDFITLTKNPLLLSQDRERILKAIFDNKVPKTLMTFLLFLNFKNRLNYLADIIKAFHDFYLEKNNQMNASFESAFAIKDDQVKTIQQKLSDKFKKSISIDYKVKDNLLGGFRLFVAGLLFDSTIKSQLQQFKQKVMA